MMSSWFSKIAAAAGGGGDDADRVDKKFIGALTDVRTTLEKTMNTAGKNSGNGGGGDVETNMDASDDGLPWALTQPSLRGKEGELKELILQITMGDEKDGMERLKMPPPPESDFDFDFDRDTAKALKALEADPKLSRLRFLLVPRTMKDETFWRNYFFQVDQIRRAFLLGIQLTRAPNPGSSSAAASSSSSSSQQQQQQTQQSAAYDARYPDASDNVDDADFASDDALHVSYDESLRAHLVPSSTSSAATISSTTSSQPVMVGTAAEQHTSSGGSNHADGDDWEAEMRRELEFDAPEPSGGGGGGASNVAALSDELDKELDFDD